MPWSAQPRGVRALLIVCVVLEGLVLAAMAVGAGAGARNAALMLGGFWPDLLKGGTGLYPGQSLSMFVTSAVLHGSPLHLGMNMIALLWLGPRVHARAGSAGFWPIAGLSALGAGAVFAALADGGTPMVGASGVLFGLLGALASWEVLDRRRTGQAMRDLAEQAGVFFALNVALALLSPGTIAWTAHMGGFLAGVVCGALSWHPRAMRRHHLG